jgi:hypothetical protein
MMMIFSKIIFLSKLSTIASGIAALSYLGNTSPPVRKLLSSVPFTGKKQYFDGEYTPLTRGYLHGAMAIFHSLRALSTGYISHFFLVVQYVASFILHNAPLNPSVELRVGKVDNIAIASHIFMLAGLGLPKAQAQGRRRTILQAMLGLTFGTSLTIAYRYGTKSWRYKQSLMPIFLAGVYTWYSSGKLFLPGTPRIPFIYILAFSIFALHKKGAWSYDQHSLVPAIMYDLFHGLQVVGTLATLRQVGQL